MVRKESGGGMKERELIWVEKEFAGKYKEIESDESKKELRIKMFEQYLEKISETSKKEFKANFESLEEDVAIYNGLMLKIKQSFEKAKNEQLQASYALWEKFDKEIPSIREKTQSIIGELEPLEKKLTTIESLLSKIRTYDMEKFIEVMGRLSGMYGKQKKMVDFLVKNFKVEGNS